MNLNVVLLVRQILLFIGVLLFFSLPGFDEVTQVKESGFSEGVNKASVDNSIILEYRKVTQEILTSQKSASFELLADSIINSLLKDNYCTECGNSGDIEIIKNQQSFSIRGEHSYVLNSGYIAAIVPSKRGDSSEVTIISISFPWENNGVKDELGSAAGLIIPLFKHLEKIYWTSKDIILLFTDSNIPNSMGISLFLKNLTTNQELLGYNGRIRTAICIEILSLTPKRVFIDIDSMDGLQTNQDFPNAIIREIESSFTYPPISILTRSFWDTITRQAFNRGSDKPHSRFLQNNIPSFTLSLVDEFSTENDKTEVHSKGHDKNEFITVFPIQKFEIYKFLEGIVKIQSNLHDELHQSSSKYYYTSYFSTLSFGTYLAPIILILTSFAIGMLAQILKENSMILIGVILSAFLLSTTIPLLLLTSHTIDIIGYFSSKYFNFQAPISINLWTLSVSLFFIVLFSSLLVTFSINLSIKLLEIQKTSSTYKEIIASIKMLNNILIITFLIVLSIKNFSTLVFIAPFTLLIILIMDSTTRKITSVTIFATILLNHYLYGKKRNKPCLISMIILRIKYFLIVIANFLHSKNFIYNFGFDIGKARNSASIWNSVMGNEIFCQNKFQYPIKMNNLCNTLFDSFEKVSEHYKIVKTLPILQWISWLEVNIEKNVCNYSGKNLYEIFTENLFHLLSDDRCLKSTMFKHLLIGLLSPLILTLSLTFL